MSSFILIPKIKIQNANALSSPYTIGFPAMTAWAGAVHALERKLGLINSDDISFGSFAIISHDFKCHTYKGKGDYVESIVGTGNPLNKKGQRQPFIEEARCNLTVSLLIELTIKEKETANDFFGNSDSNDIDLEAVLNDVPNILQSRMKFAGGDVLSFGEISLERSDGEDLKPLLKKLMPGYALIERRDLVQSSMNEGNDGLDSILNCLKVMHRCEVVTEDDKEEVFWKSFRKTSGWIVPIATGFQGVTDLAFAEKQRDPETPHRFAEAILTLGEFIMPYKVKGINEILWRTQYDEENNLYLCKQKLEYKTKELQHG